MCQRHEGFVGPHQEALSPNLTRRRIRWHAPHGAAARYDAVATLEGISVPLASSASSRSPGVTPIEAIIAPSGAPGMAFEEPLAWAGAGSKILDIETAKFAKVFAAR